MGNVISYETSYEYSESNCNDWFYDKTTNITSKFASQPIAGLYVMKDNFSVYKASRAFRFHSYYRGDN